MGTKNIINTVAVGGRTTVVGGTMNNSVISVFQSFGVEVLNEGTILYSTEEHVDDVMQILELLRIRAVLLPDDQVKGLFIESNKNERRKACAVEIQAESPEIITSVNYLFDFWVEKFRGATFRVPLKNEHIFYTFVKNLGIRTYLYGKQFRDDYKVYLSAVASFFLVTPGSVREVARLVKKNKRSARVADEPEQIEVEN